jgi:hypothetical protein
MVRILQLNRMGVMEKEGVNIAIFFFFFFCVIGIISLVH